MTTYTISKKALMLHHGAQPTIKYIYHTAISGFFIATSIGITGTAGELSTRVSSERTIVKMISKGKHVC